MVYGTINRAGCFALVVSSEKWSMGLSRGNRDDIQGTMFRGEGEDRPIDRVPEGGRSIRRDVHYPPFIIHHCLWVEDKAWAGRERAKHTAQWIVP